MKKFTPPSEEQLDLFADPDALGDPSQPLPASYGARRSDPATSHAALDAATLGRQGSARRKLALALLARPGGLTYEEAAEQAGVKFQSCPWKRLQELTCLGWAEVCGARVSELRCGEGTGKAQQVYRLTRAGREALGGSAPPSGPTEGLWKT